MLIENRVKGIYLQILNGIYLILFIVELFRRSNNLTSLLLFLFIFLGLLLGTVGIVTFRLHRRLSLVENFLIILLGLILASLIIYESNGINSQYFPSIFLVPLIYCIFMYEWKYIIFANLSVAVIIGSAIKIADSHYDIFTINNGFYLITYLLMLLIIRNYPLKCLDCDLESASCSRKNTCIYYRLKWVKETESE